MDTPTAARIDIFSTGFGMTAIGAGLLALAAVEGASRLHGTPAPGAIDVTGADAAFGAPVPALVALEPSADPQSAVGTGPGAPRSSGRTVPPASGQLVGLASNPIPNGTAIFRLWSSGRVEAMITTEDNTWGEWVVVAPGLSTDMRRPRPQETAGNP